MRKGTITVSEIEAMVSQWHWESNNRIELYPNSVSCGSQKKAFWYCEKHKQVYPQIIRARKRGETGCEMCKKEQRDSIKRSRYIKGKAVLAETHPELVREWLYSLTPGLTPYNCLAGTNKKVQWKCPKCGGEYPARIANRAIHNSGCPYCAGQKVLPRYNDLQTNAPDLALEWSEQNELSPTEVTAKSNKRILWTCRLGHKDYLATVKQRSNGQGCPECAKQSHTSFPEQAFYFYIKQVFSDAINGYDSEGYEIDIYIPSITTGIEYNGIYYHKGKRSYDRKKKEAINSQGIRLIIVEEVNPKKTKKTSNERSDYIYINTHYGIKELSETIKALLDDIAPNNTVAVDCENNRIQINEQYINSIKENSIAVKNPEVALEWEYEKNGRVKPEYVTFGSSQKYFWKCSKCGYSYLASPKERNRGNACPCCSGKVVVPGINDLKTKYPEIAAEWYYEKNEGVTPETVSFGASYEAWWKCKKNHSWQATVNRRTNQGNGCPYCSGRLAIKGETDLATTHPKVLEEWDFEKNAISPYEVKAGTNKTVWWICRKRHSYPQSINEHTSGRGCPYCSNRKVLIGFNDLASTNFDLAQEWDIEKNGDKLPTSVVQGSHDEVWWKCPACGNSWKAQIVNRNNHNGCPKCHHKYWEKG